MDAESLGRLVTQLQAQVRELQAQTPPRNKELLAIVDALQEWKYYLLGSPHSIIIHCDHANLTKFQYRLKLASRHARWALVLSEYDFVITHVPGTSNQSADALSRRADYHLSEEENKETLEQILLPKERFQITAIEREPDPPQQDTAREAGHPRKEVTSEDEKLLILQNRHASPTAGHFGHGKTYHLISKDYHWPNLNRDVKKFIQACDVCQRVKPRRHRKYGLLQPLPILQKRWSHLSMDFITHLPKYKSYDAIMVVIDRFSKMAHFIPTTESINAEKTAQLFVNEIVKLHGLPDDIVSDRGPQFISNFWQELHRALRTTVSLSTAYHP
ncbi:hypothetical protein SeMB42_g08025, partial [Synchytrium endobioticum]